MSNDDRLDEKLNPNPLPGISHDFYCTHEAVLCACWAAKVEALLEENERLRAALQALYDALAALENYSPDGAAAADVVMRLAKARAAAGAVLGGDNDG